MKQTRRTRKPVKHPLADLLDRKTLTRICQTHERDFGKAFGMETVDVREKAGDLGGYLAPGEDYYHFADRGSNVLAVFHMDTVVRHRDRSVAFADTRTEGTVVHSGALDDRLGGYILLDLLPKLGIVVDVVASVGEERGACTSEWFTPPVGRQYDHIVSFDRASDLSGSVTYQYRDADWLDALESFFRLGEGSFSCISGMDHLGVSACNLETGYAGDYHSTRGYAYLNDTLDSVASYAAFYDACRGVRFDHTPASAVSASWGNVTSSWASGGAMPSTDRDAWDDAAAEADWADDLREIHGLTDADFAAWMASHNA